MSLTPRQAGEIVGRLHGIEDVLDAGTVMTERIANSLEGVVVAVRDLTEQMKIMNRLTAYQVAGYGGRESEVELREILEGRDI